MAERVGKALPMSNQDSVTPGSRKAVLAKFAGLRKAEGATRRVDYKGARSRLNLRVPDSVGLDLQVIKLLTGEAKNEFCERILKDAIADKLKELKALHDDAAWETVTACAARGRQP